MAQGLSMETGILPEEFAEVMNSAQYRVPPMNRSLVQIQFKKAMGVVPEKLFKNFELIIIDQTHDLLKEKLVFSTKVLQFFYLKHKTYRKILLF